MYNYEDFLFCMTYSLCQLIDTFLVCDSMYREVPTHECAIINSPHAANIRYTLLFIGISHKPTICGIMGNSSPCDYLELQCLL